jgi:hypothetical protein
MFALPNGEVRRAAHIETDASPCLRAAGTVSVPHDLLCSTSLKEIPVLRLVRTPERVTMQRQFRRNAQKEFVRSPVYGRVMTNGQHAGRVRPPTILPHPAPNRMEEDHHVSPNSDHHSH